MDKKRPIRYTGKAQPGAPDWSKMTPDEARAAWRAEVEREQTRKYNEKYGALPEPGLTGFGQEYFARHPVQAEYANKALGYLQSLVGFGADSPVQQAQAAPGPGADYPKGQPDIRQRLSGVLSPAAKSIYDKYGVSENDAETALHGYMDSDAGRKQGAALMKGESTPDAAVKDYDNYVKKWSGSVDVKDATVVDADKNDAATIVGAVNNVDGKPVFIKNASNYGLLADEVVVIPDRNPKRKGKKPLDIAKVAETEKPMVLRASEFVDVLKYIRGN